MLAITASNEVNAVRLRWLINIMDDDIYNKRYSFSIIC